MQTRTTYTKNSRKLSSHVLFTLESLDTIWYTSIIASQNPLELLTTSFDKILTKTLKKTNNYSQNLIIVYNHFATVCITLFAVLVLGQSKILK